jgi:amino acid adenylation domain-containing protein
MERTHHLLTLSAKTPSALGQAARELTEHLQENPAQSLADLAYTLHVGRRSFDQRLALIAAPGEAPAAMEQGVALAEPRVAFVFTGQGAQHAGMGRLLYETCPTYRRELDRCCEILAPYFPAGFQPHRLEEALLGETEYAQPALFALEYALAQLWISWGVQPALVMGHSLGEYVAATVAGALPLEEALPLVVARGRLMQSRCEPGAMLSLLVTPAEAESYLSEEISLAAINAPRQVVLAGRPAALDELAGRLDQTGVKYRRLAVTRAFHSALADPMLDAFEARAALVDARPLQIPMISNLTGQVLKGAPDAGYWRRHVREPVRFADGVVAAAEAGINLFLEIGPHPVLRSLIDQAGLPGIVTAASLRRGEDDWKALLGGLGRLWTHGVAIDWEAFDAGQNRRRVHAPTYAFDRQSYWLGASPAAAEAAAALQPPAPAPVAGATLEERLAGLWRDVLGRLPASPADDFFASGGDSLTLLQLQSRIRQALGVEPQLTGLFAAATFGDMLALTRRLTGEGDGEAEIRRVPRKGPLPLSFAQQRLWFMDQLESGSAFYNMPLALRLRGELDLAALEGALSDVFRRHEALRTVFREHDGTPVQVILPPPAVALPVIAVASEEEAMHRLQAEVRRPFDLTKDLPLRPLLLRLGRNDHMLALTQHHIASDGSSMDILVRELAAEYEAALRGAPSPLPPLPVQYADFAAWQRDWLQGPALQRLHAYWKERLGGELPVLQLPTDRPRPAIQTFHGALQTDRLDSALTARLKALAQREGATLYMVLLAAYLTLLHRSTGQTDIIVGSPMAGRPRIETEGLIGFFASTLVLRTDLSGAPTFRDLLARVRETALGAYAHQDLPFEQLVELIGPERNQSYSPIFQTMFSLQTAPMPALRLGELTMEPLNVDPGTSRFDLTFSVREMDGELAVLAEYNTDLFDAATITRMLARWQTLLEAAVVNPSRPVATLPAMPAAEQRLILEEFSQTGPGTAHGRTVAAMLSEQARRTPSAIALIYGQQRFTYAEYHSRVNRLAHYLQQQGVGPEVLVGVKLNRTPDLVIALHAVCKAGGAYVPLDPNYPPDRIAFMIEDSGLRLVVDADWLQQNAEAIGACPDSEPAVDLDPENLIYVIYTSGSTGKPKGVALTHRSVAELMHWVRANYSDEELSGVLFSTSVSFDISVFEHFGTLCWGGAMILAENALQLPELPAKHEVRLINTAPSAGAELVRQQAIGPSVITVNLCGEALTRSLARGLYAIPTVRKVINLYGPTEDTVYSTWILVDRDGEQPPTIGRPLPGTQVYILDAHLQPTPIGVAGELYLAGRGLARGYLHRPDLTEERFPTTAAYGRIYRTGDLVRWLPDGDMEFLGRVDYQVKIRGFRIELGEVQEALLTHPAVGEAVVIARQYGPGDLRLVAYFSADRPLKVAELRAHLGKRLPDYMIPSVFVPMAELPHTPNGKVDRKALPAPEQEEPQTPVAPRTSVEERLAELWCAVLRVRQVGVNDDFFDLGGHSLMAAQLITRIRREFGVELPLRAIFAHSTVAALAAAIGETVPQEPIPEAAPSGAAAPRWEELTAPLSFAQRRIWFLDQFEPGSSVYNMPTALRLTGTLNVGALVQSLTAIVQRHEALRTTFATDEHGEPVQVVAPVMVLPLPLLDLQGRPDPEAEALDLAREEASSPFDLSTGPLLRATLLRLAPQEHILLLTVHHIVSDHWSMGVLFRELVELYRTRAEGRRPALPPLAWQYADYAVWQRQWLDDARMEEQLAYWKQRLAGAPAALDLPTDRPRPAVKTYRGATLPFQLPPDLASALQQVSRREGATLFMTLLAAFQVLLHRYSGQADISVGTPVAGRSRQELEAIIGIFVSTLVMRTDLSGNGSFRELLARVRENVLSDFAHQDLPFENLVEALQPVRDTSRSPLFQVMFTLQNSPMEAVALPGLTLAAVEADSGTAKFDLTLYMAEEDGALTGLMEYNTDLFDRTTIERMVGHLQTLLEGVAANPQTPVANLPLLTAAERQQILVEWNDTARDYRQGVCLHELIAEQVERTPEGDAVVFAGERLSYRELNRRANQLAACLRRLGVGPDVPVGICMERSLEMVVGLLGILKAGGAYVPLDPTYPPERLGFMLADAEAPVLLTQERLTAVLPEHGARVICLDSQWPEIAAETDANPVNVAGPDNTAYIIFTSGSTGRPKGVMVPHAGIVNRLLWMQEEYQLTPADRVMQKTPFCFDVSVWEFFWPLLTGAALVVANPEGHKDSQYLVQLIREQQVTTMHFVPSMLQVFAEEPELSTCVSLRQVMCSGEALPPDLVERFYGRAPAYVLLHNLYGPTEASVDVTYWACPREGKVECVPIGRPVANTQMYVLDGQLQPVATGVAGELHIGGVQLASGYLKRPDLTAEKFIPNPFGPGKLYKTGDLARYRQDGTIEYLGRLDHQVKIRGFRIELGEIEAAISRHGGVQETVVLAREDVPGQKQLVAYVVPAPSATVTAGELKELLRKDLPDYMVPSHFVMLEAMPLSSNGKLDRKALPAPVVASAAGRVPPRTPREIQLLPVWESVLGVSPIGVEDNFFELGGHSLLVVKLLNAVRAATGKQLPIASLFQGPTIARQAALLDQQEADLPWTPLVPIRTTGARPPFFCVHGGFASIFCFADLARELGPDQPFYGLQPRGLYDGQLPLRSVPDMAARYVEAIREVQPHGPYYVGGYCMGGLVARQMALLLSDAGEEVALTVMLDSKLPKPGEGLNICADEEAFLHSLVADERWQTMTPEERWADAWRQYEEAGGILPPGITDVDGFKRWFRVYRANTEANGAYQLAFTPGQVVHFVALEQPGDPMLGWQGFEERMQIRHVPGDHDTMLQPPHVRELAAQLREVLRQPAEQELASFVSD